MDDFMQRRYKDEKLDMEKIEVWSTETGERIEMKDKALYTRKSTEKVTYNHKSYVYLDTERLAVLRTNGAKYNELGVAILLAENLSFNYNICMKDGVIPHSTSSIAEVLGITPQATKKILKQLEILNVLAYEKKFGDKQFGKVYIMNPYLICRGKEFSNIITSFFNDIKPKEGVLKPNNEMI
jgi:hypothetical protein